MLEIDIFSDCLYPNGVVSFRLSIQLFRLDVFWAEAKPVINKKEKINNALTMFFMIIFIKNSKSHWIVM